MAWIRRHRNLLAVSGRALVSVATVLIWRYTGGDTAKIAPFAVGIVLLLSVGLIALRHAAPLTLPFLDLTFLLIFCYDSYDVFAPYAWLLVIAVPAFIFHLLRLRPRFKPGQSLAPLIAVTAATLMGGVGVLTAGEYFAPSTLAFLLGLGPGLLLCWFWLKNELRDRDRDVHNLLLDLTFWGLTVAAVVFIDAIPIFLREGRSLDHLLYYFYMDHVHQWENNAATMLMLAIPAAFGLSKKHPVHYLTGTVLTAAAMFSGSRGALVFVPLEVLACLFWLCYSEKRPGVRLLRAFILASGTVAGAYIFYHNPSAFRSLYHYLGPQEIRTQLILASFDDFRAHPLFGVGLAFKGHADLYSGKAGTINWYHVFPAQVIGSMGLLGVLAWGWQLLARARLSVRVWHEEAFALPLCYFGLFLMSMVNPGEFCPIPYAMLAVWFFTWIEPYQKRPGWFFYHKKPRNGAKKEDFSSDETIQNTEKSDS